jgi:hypothetical protein
MLQEFKEKSEDKEAERVQLNGINQLLSELPDGSLYGHDKLSFIIDKVFNRLRSIILHKSGWRTLNNLSASLLMQMARVRCNISDYLAVIYHTKNPLAEDKFHSNLMDHILRDLNLT